MTEQDGTMSVGCGYGLLGLCCDTCLGGPCRISPFDDGTGAASCGGDGDWMVASNLRERAIRESLQTMAVFRDALGRASVPENRVAAAHLDRMRRLLSPFPAEESLEDLFPKRAFPTLHSLGIPQGSWMSALLEAAAGRPAARRDVEAILADALRLSAIALAAEAFSRELAAPEEDFALPDTPSPLLVIIDDEKDAPDEARESLLGAVEAACAQAARIYRLPAASLPAFSRLVFAKWGVPVSTNKSTAVVASSAMIRGLGALALGYSLLPIPGYPIGGSAQVERHLIDHLSKSFGHGYLKVLPRDDAAEAVRRSLVP